MVLAQNDLYMCVSNSLENPENDNVKERFEAGEVTRSDLQRNAKNILKFIMKSQAMLHELNLISKEDLEEINDEGNIEGDILEEVYNYVTKEENEKEEEELVEKSEEIYEILTNDIITNKEEETGLEVCKKENLKDHLF